MAKSEELLRELTAEATDGSFDYDKMTDALGAATRQQSAIIKRDLQKAGALRGFVFKGVSPDGWDVYDVEFENSAMEWRFVHRRQVEQSLHSGAALASRVGKPDY